MIIRFHLCSTKLSMYFSFVIMISIFVYPNRIFVNSTLVISQERMEKHQHIVDKYYDARKNWVTSNLGEYLFKSPNGSIPHSYAYIRKPGRRYFYVMIWRHWPWLRKRHVETFGQHLYDPLSNCSVTNCKFTGNDNQWDIRLADAVVVHLQHGLLPDFKRRDADQLWIFWSDESPRNTFSKSNKPPSLKHLSHLFNWSMTYRSDSDIPVPYGRTLPLPYPKLNVITNEGLKELVPFWEEKQKDVLAANVMSQCLPYRLDFLNQLERLISIDRFGECATVKNNILRCPGHFKADCPVIAKYLFYVVIENSSCRQYITEKVFHHSYAKGAIPIIAGAPLEDCKKLLPPNSFLHVDSFNSLQDLSEEIYRIGNNITSLLSYHAWRNHFQVLEEHGFLGTRSFALCRICEALNYNDMRQKRNNVYLYLHVGENCKSRILPMWFQSNATKRLLRT